MNFNFEKAQQYELSWQKQYVKENFLREYDEWMQRKNTLTTGLHPAHFFNKNEEVFNRFLEHIKGKKALEIGCGSFPMLREAWQIEDRSVLDPLVAQYHQFQMDEFGKSFFDNLKMYPYPAEIVQEDFHGKVDGVIIFRNALDHSEDPFAILNTVSEYAVSGCYLLFWTDIWHVLGGDDGHRNLTRSHAVMDKIFTGLGFEKIITSDSIRDNAVNIDWGGVFIKK